ncbi:MAG: protein translocase subunit SecD [Gammaproteobacteria bacterium]|nr:protein translocase subunit SecD [Gammaproteobacteria bacterium]
MLGEDLLGGRRPTRRPPNRYPLWRYLLIVSIIALGMIYASPNLYPPDYALQIAPESTGRFVSQSMIDASVAALEDAGVGVIRGEVTPTGGLIRVETNEDQLRGRAVLDDQLNPSNTERAYVIALNLASTTPAWLEGIGGKPMAKGLDLSGGIRFLLEVDIDSAIGKRLDDEASNVRSELRDARIRYARTEELVRDQAIRIGFTDAEMRDHAIEQLREDYGPPNYTMDEQVVDGRPGLVIEVDAAYIDEIENYAITQNIVSLRNRVNELGVSEPLVTRLGRSRIEVNLPGVQDSSEAKRILDKFANLEIHLAAFPDDRPTEVEEMPYEGRIERIQKEIVVTGDRVTNAMQDFDPETQLPQVSITLDSIGGDRMHDATRDNIGHPMAIVFIEQKPIKQEDGSVVLRGERRLISVATIQAALGYRFRITGLSMREAQDLALLLRAGALAAPMRIVEERTVGASLGEQNIERGMYSVVAGFLLVLIFMPLYYKVFGLVADLALTLNLVILVAVMSLLGATLTLPGIAGIVLTVGMAVDANVLIFSRIREELARSPPQQAIQAGYDRAFLTILDANVTTLFVALILLSIGSGPVAGFAITLAIGIVTSMFTAIMGSRALVNLIYGGRTLTKLRI